MTSTAAPALAREALATPALRRSLAAMVRRRVPADEAEDVAQTVLCDALAAPGIPSDPEDLRRFVAGIARHKVADFHRHARRTPTCAGETEEAAVGPAPLEARAILAHIASSVAASRREQQTLEWLLREHAGEQLQTIAEDAGLPAPAVRQRVSRLRRVLRAQWGHALALLVLAGSCAVLTERAQRNGSAIVADPSGDGVASTALLAQGKWRVEHISRLEPGGADEAVAVAIEAKMVDVRVRGRTVEIAAPGHTIRRTISAATRRADGSIDLEVYGNSTDHLDRRALQHITADIHGDQMRLTIHDGQLRGTIDLVRR